MSQARIRQALESALKTWADAQGIVVAWENVTLVSPPAGAYLRSQLLPLPTESADIGGKNRRFGGVYQVTLVMPTGAGPGAADALAAAVAALYPPGVPIVVSGLSVWIVRPMSQAPPVVDRDRFIVPCSLTYAADTYL